jgi:hypothetical protein
MQNQRVMVSSDSGFRIRILIPAPDSEEEHNEGKKSKRTTKGSRRKSAGGAGLDAIVAKGDEDLDAKALKRKNQNRAAQKAFRERREARVKDVRLRSSFGDRL